MPIADQPADHGRVVAATAVVRVERTIVRAVNRARRHHGLPQLRASRDLTRVAAEHSADLARVNALTHSSSNGTSFVDRVRTVTRAKAIGETIASTPVGTRMDALAVVRAWLDSPSHRRELLSRRFRRIGVARAHGPRSIVVTADFASSS